MKNLLLLPGHDPFLESFSPHESAAGRIAQFSFPLLDGTIGTLPVANHPAISWEHAFLYPRNDSRCPTFPEMVQAKEFLWNIREVVIQVHPTAANYINYKTNALHLWKLRNHDFDVSEVIETVRMLLHGSDSGYAHAFSSVTTTGRQFVAIYGGDKWPTWEEVCAYKQMYFGEDRAAVQYHIRKELDLNDKFLIVLWDAAGVPLPPKELV